MALESETREWSGQCIGLVNDSDMIVQRSTNAPDERAESAKRSWILERLPFKDEHLRDC